MAHSDFLLLKTSLEINWHFLVIDCPNGDSLFSTKSKSKPRFKDVVIDYKNCVIDYTMLNTYVHKNLVI